MKNEDKLGFGDHFSPSFFAPEIRVLESFQEHKKLTTMNQGDSDCIPKFFKVYLPDESGDDLELPISFSSFIPKTLPKTVTVRSTYGKIYRMVLTKYGGGVEKFVLLNGWKIIAKDKCMKGGDLLAFEFDGSWSFNFCIYERHTTCKRLGRSSVQTDESKEQSDGEEESRATDEVTILDDDDDGFKDPGDDDDDHRLFLDDRENPYFTTTLNPKRKSQLRIGARVIKDYNLNFPERITLIDPLVEKFGPLERKIKIQVNGSIFVKSFGSVIRRNKVKTTDKMVCEIKKTSNSLVHTIKLHIIRG